MLLPSFRMEKRLSIPKRAYKNNAVYADQDYFIIFCLYARMFNFRNSGSKREISALHGQNNASQNYNGVLILEFSSRISQCRANLTYGRRKNRARLTTNIYRPQYG